MKKQWTSVFIILLALISVIFAVLNVEPVAVNLGFTILNMPLAVVLVVTLLIGVLLTVLLSTTLIFQYKRKQKLLTNKIEEIKDQKENEKKTLINEHKNEIKLLDEKNREMEKKIRNLNRRIQNLKANKH